MKIDENKLKTTSLSYKDMIWDTALDYYNYQATTKQTPQEMVTEFHKAFNSPIGVDLKDGGAELLELRFNLIEEEFEELEEAESFENALKELADLVYVAYGFAVTYGWDLDEAVRRVHLSNMSKLDENGNPIYREDGKVLKGPNYKEPDLKDLVQ